MTVYYVPHTGPDAADAEVNAVIFSTSVDDANLIRDTMNLAASGDWIVSQLDDTVDNVPSLGSATTDAPNVLYRTGIHPLVTFGLQVLTDEVVVGSSSSAANESSDSGPNPIPF